jgi:hypothetical protein
MRFQTVNPLNGSRNNPSYPDEGPGWTRTNFIHPSKLVVPVGGGQFRLQPPRPGDYIREQFYRDTASSRAAIVRSKLPSLLSATAPGEFLSEGDPAREAQQGYTRRDLATGRALVPVGVASPDHTPPIAAHWNNQGSNNNQAFREGWNQRLSTFRIMSLGLNLSLGSGGATYQPAVGIGFRGPGE